MVNRRGPDRFGGQAGGDGWRCVWGGRVGGGTNRPALTSSGLPVGQSASGRKTWHNHRPRSGPFIAGSAELKQGLVYHFIRIRNGPKGGANIGQRSQQCQAGSKNVKKKKEKQKQLHCCGNPEGFFEKRDGKQKRNVAC